MSALRKSGPLFEHARRVLSPTIFLPGLPSADPVELPTWEQLAERLREIAGDRPLTFGPRRAAYPDFDDFFAVAVRAGGDYLCMVSNRWRDEADMIRAIADLQHRLGAR